MSRFKVHLRSRTADPNGQVLNKIEEWPARKVAIIVCDMWDRHWCDGATQRVDELAPAMNRVLTAARSKGVTIVHAPSDTMEFYKAYPQRLWATQAPAAREPALKQRPAEPELPIDDSDQGCAEGGEPHKAWSRQHPAIEIGEDDAISDSGTEIYNLFQELGIEHVVVMGVHTNMCILARSFGLRRMVEMGVNTVLVRDLTDSMYNPAKAPFVSHFEGTELVVQHIETYICPSIESKDLSGEPPFRFSEAT